MADKTNDIMHIFNEALERRTPEKRMAYLHQACGPDTELLDKVQALLKAYEEAEDVPDGPLVDAGPTLEAGPLVEQPGSIIGRYNRNTPSAAGWPSRSSNWAWTPRA